MLEHIEAIVADDAFELVLRPCLGYRDTHIDRDALEGFAVLPAGRQVGDQPVTCVGIVNIQRARPIGRASLRPVDPQTELEPVSVGKVGDTRDAVRKFFPIRVPVTHVAKPARIQMKHLQSELRRIHDHATCERLVHRHAAAPAVVDHQRVGRVGKGARIVEHGSHPAVQDVASAIRPASERANEYRRRGKNTAGRQAGSVGARHGIEAGFATQ